MILLKMVSPFHCAVTPPGTFWTAPPVAHPVLGEFVIRPSRSARELGQFFFAICKGADIRLQISKDM